MLHQRILKNKLSDHSFCVAILQSMYLIKIWRTDFLVFSKSLLVFSIETTQILRNRNQKRPAIKVYQKMSAIKVDFNVTNIFYLKTF